MCFRFMSCLRYSSLSELMDIAEKHHERRLEDVS